MVCLLINVMNIKICIINMLMLLYMDYIVLVGDMSFLLHEIYYKNNKPDSSIYLIHADYYPLLEEYVRTQFCI